MAENNDNQNIFIMPTQYMYTIVNKPINKDPNPPELKGAIMSL